MSDLGFTKDDVADAQRELADACEMTGSTIRSMRVPGGGPLPASAYRGMAKAIRESRGRRNLPSMETQAATASQQDSVTEGHEQQDPAKRTTVCVEVRGGNLLEMRADAIVNPWNRNFVPRWILRPAGLSPQLKRRTTKRPWIDLAKMGTLPAGSVVSTSADGMTPEDWSASTTPAPPPTYGAMLHAAGLNFWWRSTPAIVQECARNIIREATRLELSSVNIPLIGAGTGGLSEMSSEKAILRGIRDVATVVEDVESADIHILIVRYKEQAI